MSKHPIDDLFARQLRTHSVKPERATWEELQRRMNAKKEQRSPFIWWGASAASIAVVLLASWWMWSENKHGEKVIAAKQTAQQVAETRSRKIRDKQPRQSTEIKPVEEAMIAYEKPVVTSNAKQIKLHRRPGEKTEKTLTVELTVLATASKELPEPDMQIAEVDSKQTERTLVVQIPVMTHEVETFAAVNEPTAVLQKTDEEQPRKKRFRIGRVFRQFSKLKAGEPVEWEEVGIQPGALMARASEKVQEGKEKVSDSYDNLRYNTFRKNSNNK